MSRKIESKSSPRETITGFELWGTFNRLFGIKSWTIKTFRRSTDNKGIIYKIEVRSYESTETREVKVLWDGTVDGNVLIPERE